MLHGVWKNPTLNYATSLTGSAPTGDSRKGLSTGHATFDWNNRLDHDIGPLTPLPMLDWQILSPTRGFFFARSHPSARWRISRRAPMWIYLILSA